MDQSTVKVLEGLRVMTFNVQLLPRIAMTHVDLGAGMPRMPAKRRGQLAADLIKEKAPHIIVLTEVWDDAGYRRWTPSSDPKVPDLRKTPINGQGLVNCLRDYGFDVVCLAPGDTAETFKTVNLGFWARHWYRVHFKRHGGSIILAKRGTIESGDSITVRDRHEFIFKNGASHDDQVNKGATLVNLHSPTFGNFTVIGTHMQADQNGLTIARGRSIRASQLLQIKNWARPLIKKPSNGVILAGDFNMPFYSMKEDMSPTGAASAEAFIMTSTLSGGLPDASPDYTYDCVNNRRALAYSGTIYKKYRNTLDYIFTFDRNMQNGRYATTAVPLRYQYDSISDHYPVINF